MRKKYFRNFLATKWKEMGFKVFVVLYERKFHYRIKRIIDGLIIEGQAFMMQTVKNIVKELYENDRHSTEHSRMGSSQKNQSGGLRCEYHHGKKSIRYTLPALATKA